MALTNRVAFHAGVWGNAPVMDRLLDQSSAVWFDEQFSSYDASNDYTLTQATTGTAAIATTAPGALLIDAGASTAAQGVNLQRLKSAWVPAANKSIWAEFYVALTATSPPVTKAQVFVGLAASSTTVISSGTMNPSNYVGWAIQTTELLALTFRAKKGGVEATATGTTLVDATAVRLGFRYDGGADTLQQYVNGAATGSAIATANIPKAVLYPTFVCQSDGTDRPNLLVYGYRILQLR